MEVVRAVYYNASLFSVQGGKPLLPKRAKEIFEGNNRTLATLMSKIIEVRRLQDRIVPAQLKAELPAAGPSVRERQPEHIMCFFAVPFRDEYDVVLEALRSVLEDAPYFWEVARADRKFFARTVPDNVGMWISRAQCYVVELSDCNPNVMMELGQMYWGYPGRPIYLLQREGSKPDIVDLGARLRIKYPWSDPAKPGGYRTDASRRIREVHGVAVRSQQASLSISVCDEGSQMDRPTNQAASCPALHDHRRIRIQGLQTYSRGYARIWRPGRFGEGHPGRVAKSAGEGVGAVVAQDPRALVRPHARGWLVQTLEGVRICKTWINY